MSVKIFLTSGECVNAKQLLFAKASKGSAIPRIPRDLGIYLLPGGREVVGYVEDGEINQDPDMQPDELRELMNQ